MYMKEAQGTFMLAVKTYNVIIQSNEKMHSVVDVKCD